MVEYKISNVPFRKLKPLMDPPLTVNSPSTRVVGLPVKSVVLAVSAYMQFHPPPFDFVILDVKNYGKESPINFVLLDVTTGGVNW